MQRSLIKLGIKTDVWGLGHDNYETLPLNNLNSYDLIINLENYDVQGWVPDLKNINTPVKLLWSIDPHCRGIEPYQRTFSQGNYHLTLQAIKDYVDNTSVWFPNCYDNSLITKREGAKKTKDLGFCGSLLNRAQLLEFLRSNYMLQPDIWVLGDQMVDTINSYWIHFNINLSNDINYRSFETIGCGTVLLTNRNPQYEELGFKDEENCLMYGNIEELQQKLTSYLKNYEKLAMIGEQAYQLASRHTYDVRAQKLLEIYKDIRT
jgi:hypothetical protein|tara:strand:+ start:2769 stop:3557 length:789 start_codon:yes stop_codon:yes gene_type:complete